MGYSEQAPEVCGLCYNCYQALLSGKMNVLPDANSFLSHSTCQWQTDEDLNLGMGGNKDIFEEERRDITYEKQDIQQTPAFCVILNMQFGSTGCLCGWEESQHSWESSFHIILQTNWFITEA